MNNRLIKQDIQVQDFTSAHKVIRVQPELTYTSYTKEALRSVTVRSKNQLSPPSHYTLCYGHLLIGLIYKSEYLLTVGKSVEVSILWQPSVSTSKSSQKHPFLHLWNLLLFLCLLWIVYFFIFSQIHLISDHTRETLQCYMNKKELEDNSCTFCSSCNARFATQNKYSKMISFTWPQSSPTHHMVKYYRNILKS